MALPPLDPLDSQPDAKCARYRAALASLLERLEADRYVLAAVLVGSIDVETIWWRGSLHLWLIEEDDVTRRRASDGEEHRLFRTLTEDDLPIHVELIPRTRFKRMVEGSSRTAFRCSFFASRELVWSRDASIAEWFERANTTAARDQANELLIAATWLISVRRHAKRELEVKGDLDMAAGEVVHAAWCLAAIAVIESGEIVEGNILHWARERQPELFDVVWRKVLDRGGERAPIEAGLARAEAELEVHAERWLEPLTRHLRKRGAMPIPLSEIADHFAHGALWPGHLEAACEWLVELGQADKHAVPYLLTKKSRNPVEEPAYQLA